MAIPTAAQRRKRRSRRRPDGPASPPPVEIDPDSALARALGCSELDVNSYHHQSTSGLGRGVRAVAWAPDGVVEAIEVPRGPFTVRVQWHAESMTESAPPARLFRAFVDSAAEPAPDVDV